MAESVIDDVADTALWVAVYRANETKRSDALFRDPYADRLAGARGRQIESQMSTSRYAEWSIVLRTHIIDQFILELVEQGVDTVLNLGAGMDTRPYRLNLPASLRWIEIDHPRIIKMKKEKLAAEKPKCRLEQIEMDLSDVNLRRSFFAKVNGESKKIAVLTEGVVPYLTDAQVSSLAHDLRVQSNFKFWIADYFSPRIVKYVRTAKRMKEMKNAPFQFFPADWFAFFSGLGWGAKEIRYLGEESIKAGRRIPMPWWVRILRLFMRAQVDAGALRTSAYVLLEPK
jgi:methyltransferase (TIGR00027 family)